MASSSSSRRGNASSVLGHPGEERKAGKSVKLYDVFINHRGPDVKETLALGLYKSLEELGITAFHDSKEKELGISFLSTIRTAIQSARVHIAIFSKGYAASPWCLEELLLILETDANIIPVFYEVEPRELRYIERGVYAQAFKEYEKKQKDKHKIKEWKDALDKISKVAGHEIKKSKCPFGFRRTAPDCKEIVLAVQEQMKNKKIKLYVARYPVGLPMLVEDFERQCSIGGGGEGKAQIFGICGMGGAGKTTLSKELYNKYCEKYTRASFLSDVRENSERNKLLSLQQKLLYDLFAKEQPSFNDTVEGISYLKDLLNRIQDVNFLIVLDDIDDSEQLENLLVTDMVNKSGSGDSLIIITTRDAGLLRRADIPTYILNGLDTDCARDLFCLHAFGKSTADSGFEILVDEFVRACECLPLSLQIMGSHLKGEKNEEAWNSALRKVREAKLDKNIMKTLKISIDSLDPDAREIFIDIACFFIGCSKNLAQRVWKASGWEAHAALKTLKDKFIVQEIKKKHFDGIKREGDGIDLGMHDHLRDLGREMARQQTIRRLWKPKELECLGSIKGFKKILGETKIRCFHSFFDTSTSSQITYFLAESVDFGEKSASLLWLQLDIKALVPTSIPSWIPLQKLQYLRICNGQLKRLWESHLQAPLQLKELQIFETCLEVVPNLRELKKLENVVLDAKYMVEKNWSLLESLGMNTRTLCLTSSILEGELADNSKHLIIQNFDHSEEMVLNRCLLSSVENLEIGNQYLVTKILISGNQFPSLKSFKLHHFENLIEIDLFSVETLNSLEVNNCKNLKRVLNMSDLTKLVKLNISECPELESELCLPSLYSMERITVDRCTKLKCSELVDCKMLVELNISECPELQSKLCLRSLSCLRRITVHRCRKLKYLELFDCERLVELNISECPELQSELCLRGLCCLQKIRVDKCGKLKRLEFFKCKNLVELSISDCPELESELCLRSLPYLQLIAVLNCRKLKYFELTDCEMLVKLNISECPELKSKLYLRRFDRLKTIRVDRCRKLKCLELVDCKDLEMITGMEGLEELAILKIQNCPELRWLPAQNLSCWERMTIGGCEKLNCHAFYSLLNVEIVTFDIGRAVEGAESILNTHLFHQVIGDDAVTDMDIPRPAIDQALVSRIIICGLVVVESSTPLQNINCSPKEFHPRKGRWIVTMVIADPERNTSFISTAVEGMCYGIVEKGFRVTLMKGQEGETDSVLETIDSNLYQKYKCK